MHKITVIDEFAQCGIKSCEEEAVYVKIYPAKYASGETRIRNMPICERHALMWAHRHQIQVPHKNHEQASA